MDRFSAHMDRSLDLVTRGKMTLALAAAHQALEISPGNPEVYNLIGYVHAMGGDFDNALENYKKAIDLDEWYLEPILNAAELLVHPDADPDEAIRLCRRAAEMDLSAQELADVTLVEVDALLGTGREEIARERISQIGEIDSLPAAYQTILGRVLLDLGEIGEAKALVDRSLKLDPDISDTWYCSGLIAREEGRRIDAVTAFLATRERDLKLPRVPWALAAGVLDKIVVDLIGDMKPDFRETLRGTRVVVEEYPKEDQILQEIDPREVVYAQGVDPGRRAFDTLWIFSQNLERVISPLNMEDGLRKLIENEIGGLERTNEM